MPLMPQSLESHGHGFTLRRTLSIKYHQHFPHSEAFSGNREASLQFSRNNRGNHTWNTIAFAWATGVFNLFL
jgi:hypothetical protein